MYDKNIKYSVGHTLIQLCLSNILYIIYLLNITSMLEGVYNLTLCNFCCQCFDCCFTNTILSSWVASNIESSVHIKHEHLVPYNYMIVHMLYFNPLKKLHYLLLFISLMCFSVSFCHLSRNLTFRIFIWVQYFCSFTFCIFLLFVNVRYTWQVWI